MQLQLHYTNCTTPQLHLHYTTTYYSYNYSCTTPHYIQQLWVRWPTRWSLQPVEPLQKTQLQPPFRPSMGSLCHPWTTTTNLSYRFPIFETSATALRGTTGIQILKEINQNQSVQFSEGCRCCSGTTAKLFVTETCLTSILKSSLSIITIC